MSTIRFRLLMFRMRQALSPRPIIEGCPPGCSMHKPSIFSPRRERSARLDIAA